MGVEQLAIKSHPDLAIGINRKIVERTHAAKVGLETRRVFQVKRRGFACQKIIEAAFVAIEREHVGLKGAGLEEKLAPGDIFHPGLRFGIPGVVAMEIAAKRAEGHPRLDGVVPRLVDKGVEVVSVDSVGEGPVPQFFQTRGLIFHVAFHRGERLRAHDGTPGKMRRGGSHLRGPLPSVVWGAEALPEFSHRNVAPQRGSGRIKRPVAVRFNRQLQTAGVTFFRKVTEVILRHQFRHGGTQIPQHPLGGFRVVEHAPGHREQMRNQIVTATGFELLGEFLRPVLHPHLIAVDQDGLE